MLADQLYIPKAGLSPQLRNRLTHTAAFQNPEFYRAERMRLSTFGKPRVISCAEDLPDHLGLPRGCTDEALGLLQSLGVRITVKDERCAGEPLDVQFDGVLRADQQAAASALLASDTGVLAASTAFGKTVVALWMICQRRTNTLVLVHRRHLVDQWREAIGQFLHVPSKAVGCISGRNRRVTGRIDIAMVQSLFRNGAVDDVVRQYGHVVADECHHVSAFSFEQVVRRCRPRFVLGLSATVTRKDGHQPIIFMQCGPVRYRTSERQQAASRPFAHSVIVRPTPFHDSTHAAASIQSLFESLSRDEARNRLIVEDVVAAAARGHSPVVLTKRREHLKTLASLLSERLGGVFVLSGGLGKLQRRRVMDAIAAVPANAPRVILATGRYLGEGYDDPRLDCLFLAMPVSWRGTLAQYAGRLHRTAEGKREVVIYDYADLDVPALARMHKRRLEGYAALGYVVRGNAGA